MVLLIPVLLVLAGMVAGLVLVLRPALMAAPHLEASSATPRVRATVHMGEEQVVIRLGRELGVSLQREEAGYGDIYVVSSSEEGIRLASRSEIGRGFHGEIRVKPGRRASLVEYFALALPGDDALHPRVQRLDRQIANGIRRIDPDAEVRVYAEPQRPERRRSGVRQSAAR